MKKYFLLLFVLSFGFIGISQEIKSERNLNSFEELKILVGPEKITEVVGISISKSDNNKLTLIIEDKDNTEVYKMITPEFRKETFKINVDYLFKGEYNIKFIEGDKLIFEKKFLKE